MRFVRSSLHMLFMAVTLIPWALAVVLMAPFVGKPRLYAFCRVWMRLCVWAAGPLMGVRNRVHGLHHVQSLPEGAQAAVLLCKHQSVWETFALPALVPHTLAYVFKRELTRIPFFGWAIGRLDMIHIDRDRPIEAFAKVTRQGRRLLEQGVWVIMFPEGTRVPRGQQGKYRSGGTRLALECGVPVIPVAVTSARCWPPRAFVKTPGVVDISFGPPIASQGRKADELMRQVQEWIETEMRRLDAPAYPAAETAAAAPGPVDESQVQAAAEGASAAPGAHPPRT